MRVDVPIWSHRDCFETYQTYNNGKYEGRIFDGNICAGAPGRDSCDGDSGGALVCYDRQRRPFLAGIVSWGDVKCGHTDLPGVYSHTLYYKNWIKANLVGDDNVNSISGGGRKRDMGNGNTRVLPISFILVLSFSTFRLQAINSC